MTRTMTDCWNVVRRRDIHQDRLPKGLLEL